MAKSHWGILKVFMWFPLLIELLRWRRHLASFSLAGSVWTDMGAGLVTSNWKCQYCTSTQQLPQKCCCPGLPGLPLSPVPRGEGPAGKTEDFFQDLHLPPFDGNPDSYWVLEQLVKHAFNKPRQAQWITFFTDKAFWP